MLLVLSSNAFGSSSCPLNGIYRADGARTLASYQETHTLESDDERSEWQAMFSALTIEWRCDRFRGWSECGKQAPCPITDGWQQAEVTQSSESEWRVHFPSGIDDDWRLVTEGNCYRIERISRGLYWEYFCRK